MKTAAIIGASSMLGARLRSLLSEEGVEVLSVGRGETSDIRLDLEKGEVSPPPTRFRADVLFHCAASFADDSPEGIRANVQVNTVGCLGVLELAEQLGCAATVYAGSVFSIETLDSEKYSSYGFSKALAEDVLGWGMKRLKRRFCSLRFSQLYDSYGRCRRHQPWFGRIIAYSARGLDIHMPSSRGVRNFLHIDDAARMLVRAGRTSMSGIWDVVHPESFTLEEIATKAYSIFDKGGKVIIADSKIPFRAMSFPDGSRAFHALGLTGVTSLAEGITRIRDLETWPAFGPLDVT